MAAQHPPLKLGIIGTGFIGRLHLRNAAASEAVELVAVAGSRGASSAEQAVREIKTWVTPPRVLEVEELLADDGVEAVLLATRTSDHHIGAVDVLRAGKHLLLEKPGAVTLAEHSVIEQCAATRSDLVVRVAYHRRHDPRFQELAATLARGTIGEPFAVHTVSREDFPPDEGDRYSGGFIMDIGVHDFDTARWLLGKDPVSAFALGHAPVYPDAGPDNAYIAVAHRGGTAATALLGRTSRTGMDIRCEVIGSDGSARLELAPAGGSELHVLTGADASRGPLDCRGAFPQAYRAEIEDFAAAIRGEPSLGATLADDRWAVATAIAARASVESASALTVGTDWRWEPETWPWQGEEMGDVDAP